MGLIDLEINATGTSVQLEGIQSRLRFRERLLVFVSDIPSSGSERCALLESCRTQLRHITETVEIGTAVPQAFSMRVQRKLSIQVPPRTIVSIDPKDATQLFRTLLDHLIEIEGVYDYISPHEIIVVLLRKLIYNRIILITLRVVIQRRYRMSVQHCRCAFLYRQPLTSVAFQ